MTDHVPEGETGAERVCGPAAVTYSMVTVPSGCPMPVRVGLRSAVTESPPTPVSSLKPRMTGCTGTTPVTSRVAGASVARLPAASAMSAPGARPRVRVPEPWMPATVTT